MADTKEVAQVSQVCTRCGLCCLVLQAKVTEEEIAALADFKKVPIDEISQVAATGPYEGQRVFKFPCPFLIGRPLHAVHCAAYTGPRPEVCRSYLCRVAIEYRCGILPYDAAMAELRQSMQGGPSFNWGNSSHDMDVLILDDTKEKAQQILTECGSQEVADLYMASRLTPVYAWKSAYDLSMFEMVMAAVDRGDIQRIFDLTQEQTIGAEIVLEFVRNLLYREGEEQATALFMKLFPDLDQNAIQATARRLSRGEAYTLRKVGEEK